MKALGGWLARAEDADELARAAEIRSELEHHLACARAELERAGLSPAAAAAEAERRFGARTRVEAECLAVHGGKLMGTRLHACVTVLLLLAVLVLSFTLYSSRSAAREALEQALLQEQLARAALADHPLFVKDGGEVRRFDLAGHELIVNPGLDRPRSEEEPKPAEVLVRIGDELALIGNLGPVATVVVAPDGKALIPEVGWVDVFGLTREELEQRLTELLRPYYLDPEVRVLVNPTSRELEPR